MKRRLSVFVLWFFCLIAQAITAEDIAQQLHQPSISGHFTQTRQLHLSGLSIESEGIFSLNKNGLLWWLQKPFDVRTRIYNEQWGQWQNDTQSWLIQPQQALGREQTALMMHLLRGEWSALTQWFDLEATGNQQAWTLTLTPNSAIMRNIFTDIVLQGGQILTSVTLRETQGDVNTIRFSLQPLPPEQARFISDALE
ncbi:outer membrane lipoprotein carrier protein LolA [Suttonella sp. R2A3]|uniref:outer membrane lipoprotein carrier protein LolA n=1 Tax=Suttonella sp. R2A3 TaxID=2908648 RepID=UPI001F36CD6E|nr:outer membrane lipoprotein carrier protein LolA [Suttonella sp. R2A3]UJF23668.1 outer membrane lipoprotein carrier protein LolA [Suttonella sp. R2A3]